MRKLLLPLSIIYGLITVIRNFLYDIKLLHSQQFKTPLICVGNITVGGTGKTPFIEYLIKTLSNHRPSMVSRGYMRRTKGLVVADKDSTAAQIGDEPMQIHAKHSQLHIAVDSDRKNAIEYLQTHTATDVILMDDGFQHRNVTAGLNILIMDYARPMWRDMPFPAGNLRELACARKRAQIWIVNKCPATIDTQECATIEQRLKPNNNQHLFFSAIDYGNIVAFDNETAELSSSATILAIAGIGRPQPFFDELKRRYQSVETMTFADHHNYTQNDIDDISARFANLAGTEKAIITTEKDAMRLMQIASFTKKTFYLPIELKILFDKESELKQIITDYVETNR